MRKPWETVKLKILLGYLFLAGIAVFTVWLIYSEILLFTENESRITRLNNKILYFNSVLTNLYQAEALERTYSQTGNLLHYDNYERLMDAIYLQFDTLSQLSDNPMEKLHTDSILVLLEKKRKNIKELTFIKKSSSDDLYDRAMDRFNINRDSINALLDIRTIITDKSESTYVEQKKRSFFERLKYAFNPKEIQDSIVQVNKQQIIQKDTIVNEINPADSVIQFLTTLMDDIRKEKQNSEVQLARKQRDVLANDRTITLQLRRMLTIFEKDIFVNSLIELNTLQERIRLTTWYLVSLGILALLVIIFFLVLILKDITRSQRYRSELEQAKAYSDSLLKSKEQIMLSITHDIKSPLASVVGYARLMSETENKDRKEVYLTNINKSSDHILKLISDLVDLTRLETGKLKFEHTSFNLYELINDTCSGFYPLAFSKQLDFRFEYHLPENAHYSSDPVRLKQVLGNIISNAVKYTDTGSVNVSVNSEGSRGNSDLIRIDISDTGIGISEGDRDTIFNEFTRLSDRKKYEGAGLGLSIAHRIITLLKGEIAVESEPGKGSRFTIRLPLEPSVPLSTLQHNKDQEYAIDRIKILAIDDDDVLLDLISEIIEKSGMQVHKCNSALQAIQVVDSFKPDLILTDLQMPSMNGMDMLAYIQRKTGKLIPVILITGQDSPDTGGIVFSDVLKKPFNPDELLNSINKVIRRKDMVIRERYSISGKSASNNFYDYNLDQIRQFTLDDPDSMLRILTSFAESSYENLIHFNKFLIDNDRKQLSELAHKMLAMFRQLDAKPIVDLLLKIERDYQKMNEEEWSQIGRETVNSIGRFINMFCEEQKISI